MHLLLAMEAAMTASRENLELLDRHLQSLRLAPEDRREALGWVQIGQRLAMLAMRAGSRRAVRSMLAVLVIAAAGGAALSVLGSPADLAPALGTAPALALAETRYSDPDESD
jgi:hypothetical protein